jgi:hypothetical protein
MLEITGSRLPAAGTDVRITVLLAVLILVFKQGIETGERPVCGSRGLPAVRGGLIIPICNRMPRVLILMTVHAQQLPVAAVGRVVIVIVILMVDRKFPESPALEFPPAAPADRRKELERAFAIALHPKFALAPDLGKPLISLVVF